jgi:hypothetical protein
MINICERNKSIRNYDFVLVTRKIGRARTRVCVCHTWTDNHISLVF